MARPDAEPSYRINSVGRFNFGQLEKKVPLFMEEVTLTLLQVLQ